MAISVKKKLFKHGGSYAIDIPMEFVQHVSHRKEVVVESCEEGLIVRPKTELDTIESEPQFTHFIRALAEDAMKHPERLKTIKDVWDKEWDELLQDVA